MILDPEALMLATFVIARRDPRLFDEALDWSMKNGRWLSVQRMKNLSQEWEGEYVERALAAFSSWMSDIDRKGRWKRSHPHPASDAPDQERLSKNKVFLDDIGQPLPLFSDVDPQYLNAGLLRPHIKTRGMTKDVPMLAPENLLLRMRSLFGLSPRAEIIAILTARDSETMMGLVHASGYSRASLHAVMADLVASGEMVEVVRSGRRTWEIRDGLLLSSWKNGLKAEIPFVWIRWLPVYRALHLIDTEMMRFMKLEMSISAVNAALCELSDRLAEILKDVGFPSPFRDALTYEDAATGFRNRIDCLFQTLCGLS